MIKEQQFRWLMDWTENKFPLLVFHFLLIGEVNR